MYEVFEHTADIGLRVRADDLETLFAEAAQGLFSLIVADLESVQTVQEVYVELAAERTDDLLFDWLAELLYHFDVRGLLLSRFEVKLDQTHLRGTARGEPVDRTRHQLEMEVKAITYHGLKVERRDNHWLAEVIVDI